MNQVTHITQEADRLKADVCRFLGWEEQDYCNLQYQNGLMYLSFYLNNDQWGVDLLHRCRVFWSWWKNHWSLRDREFFIYVGQTSLSNEDYQTFYLLNNDPLDLAKAIRPNGIVLQDTYSYMMQELIDKTLSNVS